MRLKKRKHIIVNTIGLVFLFTMININYINKKLVPFIENIVEKSVNKIIYNYVFYMFDKDTLESEYLLDIIELNKNSDGEIVSIDYNFNIAYKYLGNGMNEFYNNLSNMVIDID